ncbi:unnamed protein product, partial [Closterium sp. NIES-65]
PYALMAARCSQQAVQACGSVRRHPPVTCYMGDVSWALPAAALPATSRNAASSNSSNPADNPIANVTLTITVTASAAVAQPCRLCGGFEQLPYQVLQATVRLTAVLVPVGLKQPQPGQPLQEQALSGAATAVGSATAASAAPVAPVAPVASAPTLVVLFVRRPRGVAKVGRARFSWHALEMTGVHSPARCDACTFLCKVRPPSCTRYLCKGTSASPLSPSPLPHLPLQGASPPPPLSRYLHAASSSPLPSRLQGPSHPALAPARRHSLLSQYPVSPHLFLSRLKNKVRPPRPYPGSSPFPPPSLPRVSPPLPLFSFSFSLHIAAMRALLGGQSMWGHVKACGLPLPCHSSPPCPPTPPSPSASPPASPSVSPSSPPVNPPSAAGLAPKLPLSAGWFTARGLMDGPHRFTVTALRGAPGVTGTRPACTCEPTHKLIPFSSPYSSPRPLTAGRPPQLPLSEGVLDALHSFPCPQGWFTARGLTDGPHRFTIQPLSYLLLCPSPPPPAGRPPQLPLPARVVHSSRPHGRSQPLHSHRAQGRAGVTGTRLQAATADVGMGGEWGGGVEGGGGGGGGGRGGAQVEAQAQATYEWVADAASPVPTLTVDPPQAREGSVQISIAFDKPCLGLQCNSTETSPSEMHFSAPSFPFPLASNPVVPIPSKAASPVPTLTVDPPQAREGSAQISIAFDKPCPGLQCNSTEISPSEMHFSAPSFPFPLASNHVVPIKSGQSGANANSGPATGKGGVGAGITTGQSQVQASPQGITAPLWSHLTCDDDPWQWSSSSHSSEPRSKQPASKPPFPPPHPLPRPRPSEDHSHLQHALGSGQVLHTAQLRAGRGPRPSGGHSHLRHALAVVKFFTQLRATPRVSQSPVTCRVLFSKPVSSFPSSSLAIANATASNPQSVSDLEYRVPGSVVVDIRHENVTDVAGNICQPTQPFFFFFFFDTTPPTVQLSGSETSATTDWVYPILVAFSPSLLPLYHAALSPHFSLSRFRFATILPFNHQTPRAQRCS